MNELRRRRFIKIDTYIVHQKYNYFSGGKGKTILPCSSQTPKSNIVSEEKQVGIEEVLVDYCKCDCGKLRCWKACYIGEVYMHGNTCGEPVLSTCGPCTTFTWDY